MVNSLSSIFQMLLRLAWSVATRQAQERKMSRRYTLLENTPMLVLAQAQMKSCWYLIFQILQVLGRLRRPKSEIRFKQLSYLEIASLPRLAPAQPRANFMCLILRGLMRPPQRLEVFFRMISIGRATCR